MRYPTITVPNAQQLIVQRHARMHHNTTVEQESAADCAKELQRRMLLIVTVPPHQKGSEHVFNLALDAEQLHPLRQELLRDAERFTAQIRARVHQTLLSTGTGLSVEMLLHGVASLVFKSAAPGFQRRMTMRRLLEGENEQAIADYLATTAEVFSGQLNGHNPETGLIWHAEERLAYRGWQAGERIGALEERFHAGQPLRDEDASRKAA